MAPLPMPFLSDELFVRVASRLDVRSLGRLASSSARFSRPCIEAPVRALPEPSAPAACRPTAAPERWSVAEEGARRQVLAHAAPVLGWAPRRPGEPWLRLLREVQLLAAAEPWVAMLPSWQQIGGTSQVQLIVGAVQLRAGVHRLELELLDGHACRVGVVREGHGQGAGLAQHASWHPPVKRNPHSDWTEREDCAGRSYFQTGCFRDEEASAAGGPASAARPPSPEGPRFPSAAAMEEMLVYERQLS